MAVLARHQEHHNYHNKSGASHRQSNHCHGSFKIVDFHYHLSLVLVFILILVLSIPGLAMVTADDPSSDIYQLDDISDRVVATGAFRASGGIRLLDDLSAEVRGFTYDAYAPGLGNPFGVWCTGNGCPSFDACSPPENRFRLLAENGILTDRVCCTFSNETFTISLPEEAIESPHDDRSNRIRRGLAASKDWIALYDMRNERPIAIAWLNQEIRQLVKSHPMGCKIIDQAAKEQTQLGATTGGTMAMINQLIGAFEAAELETSAASSNRIHMTSIILFLSWMFLLLINSSYILRAE